MQGCVSKGVHERGDAGAGGVGESRHAQRCAAARRRIHERGIYNLIPLHEHRLQPQCHAQPRPAAPSQQVDTGSSTHHDEDMDEPYVQERRQDKPVPLVRVPAKPIIKETRLYIYIYIYIYRISGFFGAWAQTTSQFQIFWHQSENPKPRDVIII